MAGTRLSYFSPSTQQGIITTINKSRSSIKDYKGLDRLICNCFEIDEREYSKSINKGIDLTTEDEDKEALSIGNRILILHQQILNAAKIPVYDKGHIRGIKEPGNTKGNAFEIEIFTPYIENFSITYLINSLKIATEFVNQGLQSGEYNDLVKNKAWNILQAAMEESNLKAKFTKSCFTILYQAHARGHEFRHLGGGIFQIGLGRSSFKISSSLTEGDSFIGGMISCSKSLTSKFLYEIGVPAPRSFQVTSLEKAINIAKQIGYPVVIKPDNLERGDGVCTDIRSEEELKQAWIDIKNLSNLFVVEKHADGLCHRIHIYNGKFMSAWKRLPKVITGDGISSIRQLIDRENNIINLSPPWKRLKKLPSDEEAVEQLSRQGFAMSSIPPNGKYVYLRRINSINYGGDIEIVDEEIHQDNIDLAIKIAKNLNISNLGIDLVTNNISVSWKESSAIVCDVNISPETGEETAEAIIDSSLIKKENMDIHVFLEEQAHSQKSYNKYKELKKEGINAVYINSPRKANKEETFKNLNDLCYQASNDITTESIILSISCDQILEFGFPLKKISYIHIPGLKEVWGDYYDDPKALTELEKQCNRVKEFR